MNKKINNEINIKQLIKLFEKMIEENPNNKKAKEFLKKYKKEVF